MPSSSCVLRGKRWQWTVPPTPDTYSHILHAIGNYRTRLSNLWRISRKLRSLPLYSLLPWGPVEFLNTGHNSTDHLWGLCGSPHHPLPLPCLSQGMLSSSRVSPPQHTHTPNTSGASQAHSSWTTSAAAVRTPLAESRVPNCEIFKTKCVPVAFWSSC